ncbi:hypothetical protein BDZ91DRAFT_799977 [Kalaharituber pfeilii]|nr:hypothetical protein BDZ91DRAFT_799977 [Kalaharituber pfeilii]
MEDRREERSVVGEDDVKEKGVGEEKVGDAAEMVQGLALRKRGVDVGAVEGVVLEEVAVAEATGEEAGIGSLAQLEHAALWARGPARDSLLAAHDLAQRQLLARGSETTDKCLFSPSLAHFNHPRNRKSER